MILTERNADAHSSRGRAIAAVGGSFMAPPGASSGDVVRECRERNIRSLEVRSRDLSFLAELPELDFLSVNVDPIDVAVLNGLTRLRGLSFSGSWPSVLDFGRLPALEWFFSAETPPGGLESLSSGHARLRHLRIGRYRETDLESLGNLPALAHLEVFVSRALSSLKGIDRIAASLKALVLANCPKLDSLDGIESVVGLEYLALDVCKRVAAIPEIAGLPNLRFLNVTGQAKLESMMPAAQLPELELVFLPQKVVSGPPLPDGFPKLRAVWGPPRVLRHVRPGIPRFAEMPDDDPFLREMRLIQAG